MHIHTRLLILMQVFFIIIKRYCLKSVLLKKRKLLVVIKRCPKPFSTIPNSSCSRKYVLIRFTSTIGNPAFRDFVTSHKAYCRQDVREGGSQGTSYPGHWAIFCSSPLFGQNIGLNFNKDLPLFIFCSSPNFGQKFGLNFSEDFFCFCSLPNFGQKFVLNFSEDLFFRTLPNFGQNVRKKIFAQVWCWDVEGASAEILRPGFNSLVGHHFYHTSS